jgi:type II secretory pathway component PulF
MEIYILCLLAFIGIASFVIFKTYHWLSQQRVNDSYLFYPIPKQIVRTYNMEELAYSFIYSTPASIKQQWNIGINDGSKILTKDALDYEKKRAAEKIGREMLNLGYIEVKERPHKHNPYMNEVNLLARVYRDGAVIQREE